MTCNDKLKDLALYAGGDLDEEAAKALREHLEECPDCRRELDALKRTIRIAASFRPEAPPADEFLSGVRAVRARAARYRHLRYSALAAAAVIAVVVILAGPGAWGPEEIPLPVTRVSESAPVEVERVGYSEAVVTILPTQDKTMTIVWIVSDEVVSEEN
jgi:anti-sigma factor RsiW